MLTGLDRIVIAARYRRPVVDALHEIIGAEALHADHLPFRSAERTTLRTGTSEIDVLEPRGVGALATFVGRHGPGHFAVGLASADVGKFGAQLETQGMLFEEHESQLFLTSDRGVDLPGLNLVVTPAREREPVGLLKRLCAATLLFRAAVPSDALVRILGGRPARLSEMRQPIPGFTGTVIHLGEDLASYLAILAPWGSSTPIARFFFRHGPGIYLAAAVSEKLAAIRERLASQGHAPSAGSADGVLLIPSQLLGGARLAVYERTAGYANWDVSAPLFDAQAAWA